MATTANLSSIIRYYADKQKSPFIDLREFCAYVKKYAEHHVEEQGDLVKYLGDPTSTVIAEIQGLQEKHLVSTITVNNKKMVVSITYMAQFYANKFKQMLTDPGIPYPIITDAPKNFPVNSLEVIKAQDYIPSITENQNTKSPLLYVLDFSNKIPSMLLPACVPLQVIMETTQQKVRKILAKEEFHDYYLKKLRSSNPNKEMAIQYFFQHYVTTPEKNFKDVSDGDEYYLWSQLCYFIRQDFEKNSDRTTEDTNILQAIYLSEIYNSYLKQKFQDAKKKEEATRNLQVALAEPPYYFTTQQIMKFQDKNGQLIYGQLSQDELTEAIKKLTIEGNENELPPLLIFKTDTTKYYIYKRKVIPVVIRLCNEAHDSIEAALLKKWYNSLIDYTKLQEMTDQKTFELCLESLVKDNSPILYSLLNSNFMTLLPYEKDLEDDTDTQNFHIFTDGHLIPYSELLMLKNSQILSKTKARLPLIYTIPIISWLIGLFRQNKKQNVSKQKKATASVKTENLEDTLFEASSSEFEEKSKHSSSRNVPKSVAIANIAMDITKEMIPEGSTIDRELNYLCKEWNFLISKDANMQLTEDVNALIRDYTRKIMKTISVQTFSKDRLHNLAQTLARTPNMQKIKDQKALVQYIELYMLRLVTNTKM